MKTQPKNGLVLIVDDEPAVCGLIARLLDGMGHLHVVAHTGKEAMQLMQSETISLVLLDGSLPDTTGARLFEQILLLRADLPVVFITGYPDWEQGVDLMRRGACDYISKPFRPEDLIARIQHVLRAGRLQAEVDLDRRSGSPSPFVTGTAPAMKLVTEQLELLGKHPSTTVLITGETGTGKGVVARYIHQLSVGPDAPFVDIDCSVLPRDLCESELFGHEKGAFTGAHRSKPGLFELAHLGTAFLDEIGELEFPLQAKLLSVLESRVYKRIGGHAPIAMSVRVIAATNRPLARLVQDRKFREDLYFRLNVFEIHLPPLRERREDIGPLGRHFLDHFNRIHNAKIEDFTPAATDFLQTYSFPGNVRELRNLIERAVISCRAPLIPPELLRPVNSLVPSGEPQIIEPDAPPVAGPGWEPSSRLSVNERAMILQALAQCLGNQTRAAAMLGISRNALIRRIDKHEIKRGEFGARNGSRPAFLEPRPTTKPQKIEALMAVGPLKSHQPFEAARNPNP